jgi:hypothetical protein
MRRGGFSRFFVNKLERAPLLLRVLNAPSFGSLLFKTLIPDFRLLIFFVRSLSMGA